MADIRFKISGNTNPFFAELWNSTCTTLVQEKAIDYSGTCVIFGGLNGNTSYNLNLSDRVNCSISKTFSTPASLTPIVLPIKNINLLGTLDVPSLNVQQIISPKYVEITPALNSDQCVDLCFNVETCNISNTVNAITLYCNNIALSPAYSNCGSNFKCINMKYGDSVCYDITTYCNGSGNICGNATLNLTGVTGYGFSATTSGCVCQSTNLSVTTTTTTTTTTLTPVSVFFTNVVQSINTPTCASYCASLGTCRPLVGGESFRVNYTTDACVVGIGAHCALGASSYTCPTIPKSLTTACLPLNCIGVCDPQSCYDYFDVNSTNINSIRFFVEKNITNCAAAFSNICLNSITLQTGANFQLGACTYIQS
jgi:hypothetical protein